jgi:hypothetical protein
MCSKASPRGFRSRRPTEVVDGEGIDTALREPQRQLLVERVEPAYVGQDHDPGTARRRRAGPVRRERVAVGARDLDRLAVERTTRDRDDRRSTIEVMAHVRPP